MYFVEQRRAREVGFTLALPLTKLGDIEQIT